MVTVIAVGFENTVRSVTPQPLLDSERVVGAFQDSFKSKTALMGREGWIRAFQVSPQESFVGMANSINTFQNSYLLPGLDAQGGVFYCINSLPYPGLNTENGTQTANPYRDQFIYEMTSVLTSALLVLRTNPQDDQVKMESGQVFRLLASQVIKRYSCLNQENAMSALSFAYGWIGVGHIQSH